MAIHTKGAEQGSTRTYVPRSRGNASDPEPVSFDYRVPTEAGMQEIELLSVLAFECVRCGGIHTMKSTPLIMVEGQERPCPGAVTAEEIVEQRRRRLRFYRQTVRSFVDFGRNYSVRGKVIDCGEALAEYGHEDLLAETALAIHASARLSEDEKKSSIAPQSSSPQATAASSGDALADASTIAPDAAGAT